LLVGCAEEPTPFPGLLAFQGDADLLFTFALIGDRTGNPVPGVYAQAIQSVERCSPDLVVSIGDMIEGYTADTSSIKRQWGEYLELVAPLTMPLYFTAGNHDIWDTVSLGFYERYIGPPRYSVTIDGVHLVFLDNSRYPTIEDFPTKDIDWLASDLEANTDALQTFVFMHIPYWIYTTAKGRPDMLHVIFVRFGVDAVFTGHLHKHVYGRYNGLTYLGVGSSGARCEADRYKLGHHYFLVKVYDRGFLAVPRRVGSLEPLPEYELSWFPSPDFLVSESAKREF
jgi:3',5'-cyclic AMP phosphodiesterase CpdA